MDFDFVRVAYTGTREVPMRVHVVVGGNTYTAVGFIFGGGSTQIMYRIEADVLTGKTDPIVDEDGNIKTGFWVEGDLGESGLTGEKYEVVDLIAASVQTVEAPSSE